MKKAGFICFISIVLLLAIFSTLIIAFVSIREALSYAKEAHAYAKNTNEIVNQLEIIQIIE